VKNRIIRVEKTKYPRTRKKYVVLWRVGCLALGIKFIQKRGRVKNWEEILYPPDIQPARNEYTLEEVIRMNELILAGAEWCEFQRRHFLAVITKLPPSLIRRSK